jgi:1-deoxy-D-xylulose-5-phosphate reductoisomerase
VAVGNADHYQAVSRALEPLGIRVLGGRSGLSEIVDHPGIDLVLSAMVGYSGLLPTLRAVENGINIALANKETLVVAGDLITAAALNRGVTLYPVDSEHSAIFQCLAGEEDNRIEKIYLTASGGPFRGKKREELLQVSFREALRHPNWSMGAKITIDSASLMNKGLEVIEAKWLFGLEPSRIEVVVHPQSIIHSMVQFEDGSVKAQLGLPDMRLPIQYALSYPERFRSVFPRWDPAAQGSLTFEKPDMETFRNLALAYKALEKGGNQPCVLNAANEVAVQAFLQEKVGFLEMSDIIARCMNKISFIAAPNIEDYVKTDEETRILAAEIIKSKI